MPLASIGICSHMNRCTHVGTIVIQLGGATHTLLTQLLSVGIKTVGTMGLVVYPRLYPNETLLSQGDKR